MEVVNARASLLSNYEVLNLLRELESEYHAKTKTAQRIKKEDEASGAAPRAHNPADDISENLRTMEVEAIQYLGAEYQPTRRQSPAGVSKLVKALEPYGLTKAEKLQIVNLAPTQAVELYTIVEDPDARIGETMEEILELVRNSLDQAASGEEDVSMNGVAEAVPANRVPEPSGGQTYAEEEVWDQYGGGDEFVDDGEGAGVEGDLDMEDD
ncbi:hypothetical protein PENSPDRAFT_685501 [Peniophora sp. CONT]|nr:hypothetical protein PENSPDRAFT_685501 [Peniophora sp. CONT]